MAFSTGGACAAIGPDECLSSMEGLSGMEWTELYGRRSKPRIAEIQAFMQPDVFGAFAAFNNALRGQYNLGYVLPSYTETHGWVYNYGRSGYILVRSVTFAADRFTVLGVAVRGMDELPAALAAVEALYNDGFEQRYAAYNEARIQRRKQKQRAGTAFAGENAYKRSCVWPKKVARADLNRLYQSDARGLPDEALLDDIGLTIYARCKEAKEIYELMEAGNIKCRACGALHACVSQEGVVACACGRQYTYHAYRKSFREDNMPRGAASALFDRFVEDWERARESAVKMRLIDNMIHQCHVAAISGLTGRPVGVNLIQGTKGQITELINKLAYN